MRTPIGWRNLTHNRGRTTVAILGVSMASLLVFLQLGFFLAAFRSATMVHEQFAFDIAVTSRQYVHLRQSGSLSRQRLRQALANPAVDSSEPVYLGVAYWRQAASGVNRETVILGVNPGGRPFQDPSLNGKLQSLTVLDTALVDRKLGFGYDPCPPGATLEINGHSIHVAGDYLHGAGFTGNAFLVVSDLTFARLFPDRPLDQATFGLVRLSPGADPGKTLAELRSRLPGDVRLLPRDEHLWEEKQFFVFRKPVGIAFTLGLFLAMVVGSAILYQILSAEVINRIRAYATLKAIGYRDSLLRSIVLQQGALMAILGFLPAIPVSYAIYVLIDTTTPLPMRFTPETVLAVFLLALLMGCAPVLLTVRRIERADPADLF